jgi:nucleoside-diphosphate-sugar epimerase
LPVRNKRILITGGAGFIGSSLASRLVDDNQIVIFDNGHRNALDRSLLKTHPNVELIWADVLDSEAVHRAAEGCHIIIHMAAIAGVDTVLQMPVTTMRVGIIGTYNVLEAANKQPGLERFIDFSTSEVFGSYAYNVQEGDVTQLGPVGEARWTYAVSKLATEHMGYNYFKQDGLPFVSVRPFNIYGPGQVGTGAIRTFVLKAINNEMLQIHNDGSQIRAWCYINDILDGILLCLEKPEAVGHVFNIGNPRSAVTIYNLAQQVVLLSGSQSEIKFIEWPYADVELRVPNINKAKDILGYAPKVDLEEGLLKTIEWYRQGLQ